MPPVPDAPPARARPACLAAADEAALRAKVEQMAAQFDASQYGFFGAAGPVEEGELLGELEMDAAGGAGAAGDAPPRPK